MKTQIIKLDKYISKDKKKDTENGYIISLWKDWEKILPLEPKQAYLNVCYPNQVKGPHLHMQRSQQYACIEGTGRIIVKYDNTYEEIDIDANKEPCVVIIPAGTPSAIQNTGKENFVLINMPNPAWHPDNTDDHPIEFEGYEWKN